MSASPRQLPPPLPTPPRDDFPALIFEAADGFPAIFGAKSSSSRSCDDVAPAAAGSDLK